VRYTLRFWYMFYSEEFRVFFFFNLKGGGMGRLLKNLCIISLVCLFLGGFSIPAGALPYTMEFVASDFPDDPLTDLAPPTDPVAGTIVYEAESCDDDIDEFTSIDLIIGGHTYGISELIFVSYADGSAVIAGLPDGAPIVGRESGDDFFILYDMVGKTPIDFAYKVDGTALAIWHTQDISMSVSPTCSVPDASMIYLLVPGLVGLAGFGRKRFKN